jgi:hypothetical protein
MLGVIGAMGILSKKFITKETEATAQAGSIAEEVSKICNLFLMNL